MRSSRRTVRPRLFKRFCKHWAIGHAELRWQGATLKMHSCWRHGFFRTNFIKTIVPKNCAPTTCQSFQTLGHGTCIASLAESETKRAELLARIFQDKFHQRDCPEKLVPKTFQTVSKRWEKGHAGHAWTRYLFLGSRLVCFTAEGARTKRGRTEHRAK